VDGKNVVDSILVVTDRVNLDKQIRNAIKQFMQVGITVAWAERSGDLRTAITGRKKIIITTVHKFPIILDDIGTAHKDRIFAIIIDEAYSNQSGSMSAKMNIALGGDYDPEADIEDKSICLSRGARCSPTPAISRSRPRPRTRPLRCSATARRSRTLASPGSSRIGAVLHYPFHIYSMKQAIGGGNNCGAFP